MKNSIFLFLILGLISMSCSKKESNPFLVEWNTPFKTPPFNKIKTKDYLPAFKEGIRLHNNEIKAIANNSEAPTFKNTIDALDYSGKILTRVRRVFTAMNEAMTNDEMQKISKEISTLRSNHKDDIYLNQKLFERVKTVYQQKNKLGLNKEKQMLLDKYYKRFVRGGANLTGKDKDTFRKLNKDISLLMIKFGENVLKEINKFELVINNKDDLAGLPQGVIDAAAATAKDKGYTDKWVFTIHKPSMIPFLQYAKNRKLREKIYYAYTHKGDNNNELDNKNILSKIASLRLKRANLLGYKTHAAYVLDDQMAKNPKNVYELLNKVWSPALKVAKKERAEMQKIIYKEGNKFKLAPADWWYYAEKLKKQKDFSKFISQDDIQYLKILQYLLLQKEKKDQLYEASNDYQAFLSFYLNDIKRERDVLYADITSSRLFSKTGSDTISYSSHIDPVIDFKIKYYINEKSKFI